MAVVVQEVVGRRHGERFYPDLSGVARSYNFYPVGPAEPRGGRRGPRPRPRQDDRGRRRLLVVLPRPPEAAAAGRVGARPRSTSRSREFWAVNVGPPPPYDPMAETEYLVERALAEAEADGTLRYAASTYDADSDRLVPGTGRPGPRVLDFAPILAWNELPLVPALRKLLAVCEEELGAPVEIEFALSLPPGAAGPLRLPAGAAAPRLAGGGGGRRRRSSPAPTRGRGLDGRARQRPARGAGRRLRRARRRSRRG